MMVAKRVMVGEMDKMDEREWEIRLQVWNEQVRRMKGTA